MGTQTFSTTSTWQAPAGVSSVTVECYGGGGAGGVASGTASGAGGGAGGQYAIKVVAVTPLDTYTVTVATVATSVITGGVVVNGTDSWFSTAGTVIAKGGAGGADATGATGAGGTGSTTGGIGDTVFAGGSGAAGVSSTSSGGGGGGAGSTGTGNSGSGGTAGAAKSVDGGAGGNGVTSANTRNAGNNFGGGGSGGLSSSATNRRGGDGAAGQVILTWTDPAIPFFPLTNQPTRRLDSKKSYSSMQSFAFQLPIVTPVSETYISGQSVDPLVLESFQYDSQAEPFVISVPPPPTPFIPQPVGDTFRPQQRVFQSLDQPPQVSAPSIPFVPIQVTDLARTLRRVFQTLDQPPRIVVIPPETLTLDKWMAQSREPIRRAKRLVVYGVNTAVAKEEVPTMEWSIQSALPRRQRQGLKDYSFGVFTTIAAEPTTPAIYIQGQSVDPLVIRSFQYEDLARPVPIGGGGAPEVITLDKWLTRAVRFPQRRLRHDYIADVKPFTIAEQITISKWLGNAEVPRVRTRQLRFVESVRPPQFAAPLLPPMTWYQPTPVPRRVLARLQYLYPNLAIDAAFWLTPATPVDWLAPAKHVANAILFTNHVGVGLLHTSDVSVETLSTTDVDTATLFIIHTRTEDD